MRFLPASPIPLISGLLPEETEAQEEIVKTWLPFFWVATAVLLIGGLPFVIVAQSRVLNMVKLETAQKVFKIGFIIMSIGAVMMLWAMCLGICYHKINGHKNGK
ncbi:MAG: hypothetical protein QME57_04985 [Patescibacteria group bacterium]|nr:hypothetical protein [Patescibacteria group bacterium]